MIVYLRSPDKLHERIQYIHLFLQSEQRESFFGSFLARERKRIQKQSYGTAKDSLTSHTTKPDGDKIEKNFAVIPRKKVKIDFSLLFCLLLFLSFRS